MKSIPPPKCFIGFLEQLLQIVHIRHIRADHRRIHRLRQFVDLSHPQRHRRIRQHQLRTFFMTLQSRPPRNGPLIQRAENDSFFPF
jgi:hypothetical protein